jgi:arylsulfatase B
MRFFWIVSLFFGGCIALAGVSPWARGALPQTAAAAGAAAASRPNVVVIVSDDMGWTGVDYHGGVAPTPNIDRIAHQGVELDRFYVSPMCSPTRAGLMTGRYPMRFGMARTVVHPWSQDGLPPAELTLAEALAPAGYRNRAIFGKWHLGHMNGRWLPLSNGFTEFVGCYTGEIDYFTHVRVGEVDWHHDFDNSNEKGYVTDLIADHSAGFIAAHAREGPFFCYTAFTAPHTPLEVPQKYLDRFEKLDDNPADGKPSRSDGKPSQKQLMAGMISCLDDGIGRILSAIDQAGISDNTLIIYMNDNGGITSIPGNNTPLRGGKFTVYEGGVRVPAAIWWPGHISGGRKIETPLMNIDIMPTVLSICGIDAPSPAGARDGLNASSVLLDAAHSRLASRDLYFFCGQWGLDNEQIGITTADGWKLIVIGPDIRRPGGCQSPGHQVELYRINDDPDEQHDLAAQQPAKVRDLSKKLVAFRASEPAHSMPPINHTPADFKPPAHWYIPPPGG